MEDQIQRLELKITELENKLKELGTSKAASGIDPEEMKIYHKVSAQLSPIICTCSICIVCRICHFCINECSCGPCSFCNSCFQHSPGSSAGAGFSSFMK